MPSQLAVVKVNQVKNPTEVGRHYRLLCLSGNAKGTLYYLNGKRIVLGRGDSADIKVSDIKSSREHAEITKFSEDYIVTDLGSQNGIIVNDNKVHQHRLKHGDTIIIGQTVYKYQIIDVDKPKSSPALKKALEQDSQEEVTPASKKRLLIYGVVALLGFWLLTEEDKPSAPGKKAVEFKEFQNHMDSFQVSRKNKGEDREEEEKLKEILHRGQREYREGNYYRAMSEFKLALVISPDNARASYYLDKSKRSLKAEVERSFIKARQEMDSLKYESALVSYCSIIRMLQNNPEDQAYKDSMDNVKIVEEKLGMYPGEIKCIEE